jgi:DNA-binding NarL/FixJ family response regulator
MPLTPRQADAITAAADGAPLHEVGARLGVTRGHAASLLSRAYERLDVAYLPRDQRRTAALRTAVRRGLITVQPEESTTP